MVFVIPYKVSLVRILDSKEVNFQPLVTTNLKSAMAISTYLSIITLNVNGLNAPIKIHRVTECIKKQDQCIYCLQEIRLKPKDIHRLRGKGRKKILHATNREKKSRCCSTCIEQNRL